MRHTLALCAVAAGATLAHAQAPPPSELVASTGPRTPAEERSGFHLPPGFTIQLVAAEPTIHKPMNLGFDDKGRLWVTSSLEYPWPAKPGAKARDQVVILDDFDDAGLARRSTVFADGLNIPIGLLPLSNDSALVYDIPRVRRFTDTDGDGKADKDETAYESYGSVDTHGMTNAFTVGFDGWIYACHGFANTSAVKGQDGQGVPMQSGNTYRMRADGSHAEPWTHGQVNPFGIAIDPLGNLFTCDCHSKPIYQLIRGSWYPSFGKPHDGLGFGPEMIAHDHYSTGIAGIVYYAADQFPAPFRDNILIGNVVTSRINRDTLQTHGSTLQAVEMPDFLASDDPWFRPVDIKLGPDGALYVADFYNKIIGHYEVPLTHPGRDRERGRIWKITYTGTEPHGGAKAPHADWTKAAVDELVGDLSHPNLAVRLRSTNQLVDRPGAEIDRAVRASFETPKVATTRSHGLWVLERRGSLDAPTLAKAVADPEAAVRVHAMRVLTERPGLVGATLGLVLAGLKDADAFVRRAAAEALGRHPSPDNLRPLLDLLHGVPADDTHLVHAARIALRDQLLPASTWEKVDAATHAEADARSIADVSLGVPTPEAAAYLLAYLKQYADAVDRQLLYVHHVARYGRDEAALVAYARGDRAGDLGHQGALVKAVSQGVQERGRAIGPDASAWAGGLVRSLLGSMADAEAIPGIELAASLKLGATVPDLLALGGSAAAAEPRRAAAFSAASTLDPAGSSSLLGRVVGDAAEPIGLREQAGRLLAQGNRVEDRARLLEVLPVAPGRLQSTIALGLAAGKPGAEALLAAVGGGKASARLLQERPVELRLKASGVEGVEARIAGMLAGLPATDGRLLDLLARRKAGFVASAARADLGSAIFGKHCAGCHQMEGKGGRVGPQLDGVGARGADRLMEDILDPNRNIDQAFRSTNLALKSGRVLSGLLLREEGEVLVLADAQGKEVRVDKADVEDRAVAPLSPMPSNFVDEVNEADFGHLIGYLLSRSLPAESPKAR